MLMKIKSNALASMVELLNDSDSSVQEETIDCMIVLIDEGSYLLSSNSSGFRV